MLGAMLMDRRCVDNVLSILKPESFYRDSHQKICAAIVSLISQNKPVDILTVTEELRKSRELEEVGGPMYVTGLTSKIAGTSHAEYHAAVIQDMYIKRELIRISSEIQSQSFDESNDSEEILSFANLELNNVHNLANIENAEILKHLISERVKQIEEISKNENKLLGVPSGLIKLDRITGGWQKTDLIIIAARPSVGKTSFTLFCALEAASLHYQCAFFSLEMSKMQLVDKSLSYSTDISPATIRTGKMNWTELENGIGRCINLPLYIDDTPALTLMQLRTKITRLLRDGIKAVYIDYLQLMNGKSKGLNRDQEIGELTGGIKAIAKECNIPIILLSQLNRAADGKRPMLSNLRESGNIEQDADIVIFLHRPDMNDENGDKTHTEIIIAKHRNGPVGMIDAYSNEFLSRYYDQKPNTYEPF